MESGQRLRCHTQVDTGLFDPEGRLTIAQQFTAGDIGEIERIPRPVGTVEAVSPRHFQSSLWDYNVFFGLADPAINRWAIVKCPYGARSQLPDKTYL
jgi:hypothetical protein